MSQGAGRTDVSVRSQESSRLLRQPGGFEGFGVTQEVPRADDLPASEADELSELLVESDASRPAGHVEMTEDEDRLAEVANLLNLSRETFPRPAAIVVPGLARAVKTPIGGFPALQGRLNGGMPLHLGVKLGQEGVKIVGIPGLENTSNCLDVLLRHRPRSIAGCGKAVSRGCRPSCRR